MIAVAPAIVANQLRETVQTLAGDIGERHVWLPKKLAAAADFIEAELDDCGYHVARQGYEAEGQAVSNLEAELPGTDRADEGVVVGAHYDSRCGMIGRHSRTPVPGLRGTPGADDNGSGVAAVLALARAFADRPRPRTLRFVAFVNEERPFFATDRMGSWVYSRRCRARGERVVAAVVPETLGYYSDEPGSQGYGVPLSGTVTGSRGDFLGLMANRGSRHLVRWAREAVARHTRLPVRHVALPIPLPRMGWSDDWAFWREGYPAFIATDTAFLRYPHYHRPTDTPDKLDYRRFAEAVEGLRGMLGELADGGVTGGW